MYSIAFMKLLAELSLYFSFVVMLPEVLKITSAPYIAMIAMALGQGVNFYFVENNKRELRRIGIIFPILGLASSFTSVTSVLVTIPAFIYTMYVINSYPILPDDDTITTEFRLLTLISAVALFVGVMGNYLAAKSLTDATAHYKHGANFIDARSMGVYLLIFVVTMGLCVRQSRYGGDYGRSYNLIQLAEYAMVILPGVLVCHLVSKYWRVILSPTANSIKEWFARKRAEANARTYSIFRQDMIENSEAIRKAGAEWVRTHKKPFIKPVTSIVKYDDRLPHLAEEYRKQFPHHVKPKFGLTVLNFVRPEAIVVLVFVAIILAAILIFKRERIEFSIKKLRMKRLNGIQFVRPEKATRIKAEKKKIDYKDWSNREKVRRVYREFLESTRKRGIKITDKMTSEEVLNAIRGVCDEKGAVALRDVYIVARYNDYASVSNEQVRMAKEALKQI